MKELVSVIIPAYQEEKRIRRCLRSILNSTYRNLELIVVNDGSTDNTERIVRDFKRKNESCTVSIKLVTISKGGSARARNYGLCLATGDYIGFVDADDMIHPQMIERLVNSLRQGNDLSVCGMMFCNESGRPGFYQYRMRRQKRQCPYQALTMIMWEQIQMSICPVLFRREKIVDMEGRPKFFCPEDVVEFEDFAFICEYVSRCQGFIEVLPFRGYFYCKRKGSLTAKKYTVEEICHALEPILSVGERMNQVNFNAHKLQYAFRLMAFWYEEAFQSSRQDFVSDSENWIRCRREIERYADIYMKASNVALYRKGAMWIARKCPDIGWLLAKTAGRVIFRS